MAFNKKLYWENRKSGKRGQGEVPAQPRPPRPSTDESGAFIVNEKGFDDGTRNISKQILPAKAFSTFWNNNGIRRKPTPAGRHR